MIPVVPFLCKKVRLRLEGCGCHTGLTNATNGLTLFSGDLRHKWPKSLFHYGGSLEAGNGPIQVSWGHTSTTELEAPKLLQSQGTSYQMVQSQARVSKETLSTRVPQVNEGEMKNALVEV